MAALLEAVGNLFWPFRPSAQPALCTHDALAEADTAAWRARSFAVSCAATKKEARSQAAQYARLVDKVEVKKRVTTWLPELKAARTLAVVRNATVITPDLIASMPAEYAVKGTHGAGMVMLVRGEQARVVTCGLHGEWRAGLQCKASSRSEHARFIASHCSRWLAMDYGRKFGEVAYSLARPGCLFEGSLIDAAGDSPRDVRVFVLHGEPLFLMDVASRYGVEQHKGRTVHVLVDTAGRALPGAYGSSTESRAEHHAACAGGPAPTYPAGQLAQLLRLARRLAAHAANATRAEGARGWAALPQMRVDFFVAGRSVWFSELTFFHQACTYARWTPPTLDALLGHLVATPRSAITPRCLGGLLARACPTSSSALPPPPPPPPRRSSAPVEAKGVEGDGARHAKRLRWLVAMSAACGDATAQANAAALCALGVDRLVLNAWSCAAPRPRVLEVPPGCAASHHFLSGMVGRFWKEVLTPAAVRGFDIVWLIDDDVRPVPLPAPASYLGRVEAWFARTRAHVLQPSVMPRWQGGVQKATRHSELIVPRNGSARCAALATPVVELMTPMHNASAWARFHAAVLARVPDARLRTGNWGLDVAWSGLGRLHGTPAVVARDVQVVHDGRFTSAALAAGAARNRSAARQQVTAMQEGFWRYLRGRWPSEMSRQHADACFAPAAAPARSPQSGGWAPRLAEGHSPPPVGQLFSAAEQRTCRHRVALTTGFFGGYDAPHLEPALPRCMRGVVYTDRVGWTTAKAGWSVRYLLLPGTDHVSPARLATKHVKWHAFLEFAGTPTSAVLYRDMNVRLRNLSAAFALLDAMDSERTDLLLRDWHYPHCQCSGEQRIWWEMEDIVTRRANHVARSRAKVLEWRAALNRSGLSFPRYAEGNLFLYRPSSPVVRRIFQKVFEKMHEIERDQFVLPWAMHDEPGVTVSRALPLMLNATKVGHLKRHGAEN